MQVKKKPKKTAKAVPEKSRKKKQPGEGQIKKQPFLKRMLFGEEKPDLSELEAGSTTILDILSPTTVDTKSRDYIIVDDVYHAYLYITGYGYTTTVGTCWLAPLVEAGEGINLSFLVKRQPKEKILSKIAQTTMVNRSRMRDVGDTRQDYEELDMAVSDRKYLGYYPIAQAKAWLSGHDKVESCDLLALKNYLWHLPSDREKVEAVLTRLCVNPMQDKVNNIRGMALESQEEFDAALGDGSKADTARKAFIKLRGELTHLYQMQCSLRTAAQSDSEIALVDDLLADLEKISRKAHEQTHFTYTTLEEIAALN